MLIFIAKTKQGGMGDSKMETKSENEGNEFNQSRENFEDNALFTKEF